MPVHNSYIPPMSIFLDSSLGIEFPNGRGNRVSFPLQTPIIVPSNQDLYVQLIDFRYSNVFYNISEDKNVLYYQLQTDLYSETFSITLTPGNYDINRLLEALNLALAGSYFEFTYAPETFRLTATNSAWAFKFVDGVNCMTRSVLGFQLPTPGGLSCVADYSINLSGTGVVNISIPNFYLNSNGSVGYTQSVLASVLNDVVLGSTKSISSWGSAKYRVNQSVITQVDVVLTGDRGVDIDFHGLPWFLSLTLSYVYKFPVLIPRTLMNEATPAPPVEPAPAEPATNTTTA